MSATFWWGFVYALVTQSTLSAVRKVCQDNNIRYLVLWQFLVGLIVSVIVLGIGIALDIPA
jgi:hypothetical protein